ncbi:hypothetical protein AKJ52_01395 [candidate division MSBL1 archaeon SCGC-AAA382C18]|uniref:Uncharacterized protein n=1 Tax=candidate division MSBL1 archaeon SCGC-AAA382C18 TaxID=1698281 RepID=A0A133VKE9_9EURY|nr:hypothetical protein AKJ52_01395 [candidate division MSBL1 archaeon SCGC-AAA382C18]
MFMDWNRYRDCRSNHYRISLRIEPQKEIHNKIELTRSGLGNVVQNFNAKAKDIQQAKHTQQTRHKKKEKKKKRKVGYFLTNRVQGFINSWQTTSQRHDPLSFQLTKPGFQKINIYLVNREKRQRVGKLSPDSPVN